MTTVSSFSTRSRPLNPLASSPEWVHARFERAVDIIQSLPKSGPIQTNYEDKLSLYASYKQATEGDIKTSRPGLLDVLGRAKWDAWNKRKGLTQMQAERAYVEALIRILKGYADRTQAVELLKELETFSLDPRGGRTGAAIAGHGSIAPSRTESSHSSDSDSSSTASYDDRRSMPPPPLPSSSRHQHHHHQQHSTRSSRTLAPPPAASPSASGARSRPSHLQTLPPPPPSPAPADAVAPPLPGYGPPRTQPDAIRHSPRRTHRHRRRRSREYSSSSSSGSGTRSGSGSETESEEEDTRNYHPAPSHRSFAPAPPQPQQALPPPPLAPRSQRGPPSLPPHPSQLASSRALRPPPPLQMPSSLRSVAGSERSGPGGGGLGQGQQVAVAYPAGYAPSLQQRAGVAPLTSANLRTAVLPPTPISASTPALPATVPPQRPELDAALQRIQTSLTALHERLSLLESTPGPSSSSSAAAALTSASSPLTLLREVLRRLLILLRLRSSNPTRSSSPPAPSSPSVAFRTPSRPPTPSLLSLLWRLSASLFRTARRSVSDALVVFAVVVILGRMRGVDVPRVVGGWVVRYAAGVGAGGARGRGRVEGA